MDDHCMQGVQSVPEARRHSDFVTLCRKVVYAFCPKKSSEYKKKRSRLSNAMHAIPVLCVSTLLVLVHSIRLLFKLICFSSGSWMWTSLTWSPSFRLSICVLALSASTTSIGFGADPNSNVLVYTSEPFWTVLWAGALGARYIASFHFITATMMAVGYGEIWAKNTARCLVRLIHFDCCIVVSASGTCPVPEPDCYYIRYMW